MISVTIQPSQIDLCTVIVHFLPFNGPKVFLGTLPDDLMEPFMLS